MSEASNYQGNRMLPEVCFACGSQRHKVKYLLRRILIYLLGQPLKFVSQLSVYACNYERSE
jgi:hypothetical protein